MIQLDPPTAAPPVLHGWVEELETGVSAPFGSAAALVMFLERALQAAGTEGGDKG